MKSKGTAAILAFFLGGIGGHKFYLNQTSKGVLYLVFCWTFIPALLAVFEFIVLLLMSDDEFNQKYNTHKLAQQAGSQMGQNVTVNIPGSGANEGGLDRTEKLEKLKKLHTEGTLTDEEFRAEKQKLLAE